MQGLILWKNQEIDKFRRDMERLFSKVWDDFSMPLSPKITRDLPFIDVSETEDDLFIRAELPGIAPEDLDISVSENLMTIKGEMKQETVDDQEGYRRLERRYGTFSRTIQFPCKVMVDEVAATYEKGILNITVPKCKAEETREVKIKVT